MRHLLKYSPEYMEHRNLCAICTGLKPGTQVYDSVTRKLITVTMEKDTVLYGSYGYQHLTSLKDIVSRYVNLDGSKLNIMGFPKRALYPVTSQIPNDVVHGHFKYSPEYMEHRNLYAICTGLKPGTQVYDSASCKLVTVTTEKNTVLYGSNAYQCLTSLEEIVNGSYRNLDGSKLIIEDIPENTLYPVTNYIPNDVVRGPNAQ